jgi:hypothetical protein
MDKRPLPDQAFLAARLSYDPETGLLYWLTRTPDIFTNNTMWTAEQVCASWNSKHAKKEAFTTVSRIGYKTGLINGRAYVAARIIWKLVHGYDPVEIDHINRVKTDNRLANLREANRADNCRNRGLLRNNTSGVSGVYLEKSSGLWVVEVNGKRYGRRKSKAAAIALRSSIT